MSESCTGDVRFLLQPSKSNCKQWLGHCNLIVQGFKALRRSWSDMRLFVRWPFLSGSGSAFCRWGAHHLALNYGYSSLAMRRFTWVGLITSNGFILKKATLDRNLVYGGRRGNATAWALPLAWESGRILTSMAYVIARLITPEFTLRESLRSLCLAA